MRVLVTGGFGFIGGRLAQTFATGGHQVVLGTRTPRPVPEWLSEAEVAQMSWNNEAELAQICAGVDLVVHAAGLNAQQSAENPALAFEINGLATSRLAAAASSARVERFIYLSTAHVYDDTLTGEISEESCPKNLHPYASSHLAGEQAVLWQGLRSEMVGIVVRLSNAFGAPADPSANCWMLLANDLCRQLAETGAITLRTAGNQMRDFIPLRSACQAIPLLAQSGVPSGIFNLGSGNSMSVKNFAYIVQTIAAQHYNVMAELNIPANSGQEDKSLNFVVDKIKRFGFEASESIEAEVAELIAYCFDEFGPDKG